MKNDVSQYVDKDSVMTLVGKTKLEVMDQLISRAADITKLSRDLIFRLVWKREQMMTTGVGGMLALPHIRINDILHPYVIVGVCENPIEDYQGQDDQPVRVIVFTVAPDENQEAYLQLLSSISRRLRNPKLIEQMIGTVGNTVDLLAVDISATMRSLLDDQHTATSLLGTPSDHSTKESGSNYQIIVFLHIFRCDLTARAVESLIYFRL